MTTIIGLEHKDRCFIVVDSQTTDADGRIYTHPEVKKISENGMFLIAGGGEIFDVDQELSISKSADGGYAAGSGASYALGALYAGADAYQAMEIASKLTAFTAGPYISKEQPRKIK